jgi:transcription elongation factor Elf1
MPFNPNEVLKFDTKVLDMVLNCPSCDYQFTTEVETESRAVIETDCTKCGTRVEFDLGLITD